MEPMSGLTSCKGGVNMLGHTIEMINILGKLINNSIDSGLSLLVLLVFLGILVLAGSKVWSWLVKIFNGVRK